LVFPRPGADYVAPGKKSREKKVGERKLDITKGKIAFQFPSVRQKLMVREMIRKRRVEGTT
jgi:hypothetical protein